MAADTITAGTEPETALVEAPTGLTGFLLVMSFPGSRAQNKQDAQGRWIVRVPVPDEAAVQTLLVRVQAWLRAQQIAETSVSVGADRYRVSVDRADLQHSG